ncbi:hotdog fold thioesterase [Micrococcus sp. ACRRV]|uniref:hotdog fold thioesterase n=1 Tax=Micrococcus sp. ACRRV TaxID=2918203 RepID=UPI00351D83E4
MTDTTTAPERAQALLAGLTFHAGIRPELTDEERAALATAAGMTPAVQEALGGPAVSHLALKMGIRFLELSAERSVATMPVAGNEQPVGLLHGGAHLVLAESLGSLSAKVHAGPHRGAVGTEIGATHHRSVRSGLVTGTATAIHLGRTLTTHEIVMTDEQGRRLSTVRMTNMLLDPR